MPFIDVKWKGSFPPELFHNFFDVLVLKSKFVPNV